MAMHDPAALRLGATMSRRFQKILEEIANAAGSAKQGSALPALGAYKSLPLEWQIRKSALIGDRIVFFLGCALTVSSMSFVVYAVRTGGASQPSTLTLPRFATTNIVDRSATSREKVTSAEDPISTGTLQQSSETASPGTSSGTLDQGDAVAGLRGYKIRRAFHGFATLEGPDGTWDVVPGVEVPGLGKVLSVEKVAGQWVVVTSEGFIRANLS